MHTLARSNVGVKIQSETEYYSDRTNFKLIF